MNRFLSFSLMWYLGLIFSFVAPYTPLIAQTNNEYNDCLPKSLALDNAQAVFVDNIPARIDITIAPTDIETLLNNPNSDTEFLATFSFNNASLSETLDSVGFGLRGNTSLSADKKSFKISFNTYQSGRTFKGLEKMNLNGEHNDPSLLRSKLYWHLANALELPAPRANFVSLYINNNFMGVYLNVEHIDERFVERRFHTPTGNLYKCLYPANLSFINNTPDSYKLEQFGRRIYELRTNILEDDYSDLANFIDVIRQTANSVQYEAALEAVFDVDTYLRTFALDIVCGHWDSYHYNTNNYFLYQNPDTRQFVFLSYDVDNTFGIDWIGQDWASRNVYSWTPQNNYPPLATQILSRPAYRNRLSFYINQILQTVANPADIQPLLTNWQNSIASQLLLDPYYSLDYGFEYTDFLNSLNTAWGGHVDYGIVPFLQARKNSAQSQLSLNNIPALAQYVCHSPVFPVAQQALQFTIQVHQQETDSNVQLQFFYRMNGGTWTQAANVTAQNSVSAAFHHTIFSLNIQPTGGTLEYYVLLQDANGQGRREPLLDNTYHSLAITPNTAALRINECMTNNLTTLTDNWGEYDDWIELYNADNNSLNLQNFYLSDNPLNPQKWQLPAQTLAPQQFLLIWADEDAEQGNTHANFRLNSEGEFLGVFDQFGQPIHTIQLQPQQANTSEGLLGDGNAANGFVPLLFPTPNASNWLTIGLEDIPTRAFSNDFEGSYCFAKQMLQLSATIETPCRASYGLYDALGRKISISCPSEILPIGKHLFYVSLLTDNWSDGVHFLHIHTQNLDSQYEKTVVLPILLHH